MEFTQAKMRIGVVIVAAGRGQRAGGDKPKQWQEIAGKRVAAWTCETFKSRKDVHQVVLVIHPDDQEYANEIKGVQTVLGGSHRDISVRQGLGVMRSDLTHVLIHDVARCAVSHSVIDGVLEALQDATGAAPALPVTDALWTGEDGKVSGMQSRDGLFRAQTPQGFLLPAIVSAHQTHEGFATDDVEVAIAAGIDVVITQGDENNIKITTAADFERVAKLLEA